MFQIMTVKDDSFNIKHRSCITFKQYHIRAVILNIITGVIAYVTHSPTFNSMHRWDTV